jgi:small subunit ribosomal protein S17
MAAAEKQTVRRELEGRVVAHGMDRTIVVRVERRVRHRLYGKEIRRAKKHYAHDEKNEARTGDTVRIMATRPLSKLKRWRLVEVVRKGPRTEVAAG